MRADHEEMMAKLDAYHEEMMTIFVADRGETKAYPKQMEANPEIMEPGSDRSIGRSLRKMPQWKLAERRISGIGTGI
jgi:hypothetical protein